jgi:hypothetical protein
MKEPPSSGGNVVVKILSGLIVGAIILFGLIAGFCAVSF